MLNGLGHQKHLMINNIIDGCLGSEPIFGLALQIYGFVVGIALGHLGIFNGTYSAVHFIKKEAIMNVSLFIRQTKTTGKTTLFNRLTGDNAHAVSGASQWSAKSACVVERLASVTLMMEKPTSSDRPFHNFPAMAHLRKVGLKVMPVVSDQKSKTLSEMFFANS